VFRPVEMDSLYPGQSVLHQHYQLRIQETLGYVLMNQYKSLSKIKTKSALKISKETSIPISLCKRITKELNS